MQICEESLSTDYENFPLYNHQIQRQYWRIQLLMKACYETTSVHESIVKGSQCAARFR